MSTHHVIHPLLISRGIRATRRNHGFRLHPDMRVESTARGDYPGEQPYGGRPPTTRCPHQRRLLAYRGNQAQKK